MGRYTKIPQNTFDTLQLDAGVLLKHFDIEAASASAGDPGFDDDDLICATTGGINPSCVPTFSDLGEDVDNVPNNMKELKHLDGWECALSTTSLGTSAELIRLALGCADFDSTNTAKIVPRANLKQSDFSDLWWVGDKANGGFVAIRLMNALSTGGFSLQTTKNGKGQTALTITGHVSINAQDVVPMEFYSIDPEETVMYTIAQNLTNVTSDYTGTEVEAGSSLEITLTEKSGYTMGDVTVTMGGEDVTATAYSSTTGKISISEVTGNVVVTAEATE